MEQFWAAYGSVVLFVLINMILAISIYFTLYTGLLSIVQQYAGDSDVVAAGLQPGRQGS